MPGGTMGNVVEFVGKTARARRPVPDRLCEIKLFTGVRYERHEFESDRSPLRPDPARRAPGDEAADRAV